MKNFEQLNFTLKKICALFLLLVLINQGKETIEVLYSGPEININFNSRYILDVLAIIKDGEVNFNFSKDTSPTVLTSDSSRMLCF